MRIYVVERNIDRDSARSATAYEVIRSHYPDAEKVGGAGYYETNQEFRDHYQAEISLADMVISTRRTLGLGGTVEIEEGLRIGLPVFTVHGRKLQAITHLWYVDERCVWDPKTHRTCLRGYAHRGRMHDDPNKVAETRAAPVPAYAQNPDRL